MCCGTACCCESIAELQFGGPPLIRTTTFSAPFGPCCAPAVASSLAIASVRAGLPYYGFNPYPVTPWVGRYPNY